MSLLALPDELLLAVVAHLAPPHAPLPLTFAPNCARPNYADLLSLASTCSRLRQLCAPQIFRFASLVRRLAIDAVLAYPLRLDKWSDRLRYRHAMVDEIIAYGFQQCNAELLGGSSRYVRRLACCNYVAALEIGNASLAAGELHLFPNLHMLKVLDTPLDGPEVGLAVPVLAQLEALSVNFQTLLHSPQLLAQLRKVQRLDTLMDEQALNSGDFAFVKHRTPRLALRELNVFVTDPEVLRYRHFVDLVAHLASHSPLESVSIRLTRKTGSADQARERDAFATHQETGPAFLAALHASRCMRSVTVDFDIINWLLFPMDWAPPAHAPEPEGDDEREPEGVVFTLIDYTLSVPKLLFHPREIVANIVQSIRATEVVFIYGELIDQAHLHAIGVMSNLLVYLALDSHRAAPYSSITRVGMEKAWSVSDELLLRHHYEELLDRHEAAPAASLVRAQLHRDIVTLCPYEKLVRNSPRFRVREQYIVIAQSCALGSVVPIMLPAKESLETHFWSIEASLRDMEHYCMRQRSLLRFWD